MERDLLAGYLADGLSLERIGALVGKDASTVGYWVKKHGLIANGRDRFAPRGGLQEDLLKELVAEGLTIREIAERLDRSVATVRHWMAKYELRSRGRPGRRPRPSDAQPGDEFEGDCARHGLTRFRVERSGRVRCLKCRSAFVTERRRRVKLLLVEEAGGGCAICGYGRFPGALQFHHLDPQTKRFMLSRQGITRSISEARTEASKCLLLCANCHAEVEGGVAVLPR